MGSGYDFYIRGHFVISVFEILRVKRGKGFP